MLQRLLLALLPALLSCSPLAAPPGGRLAALLSSRQVATSQQILGELQHLFRQAASGQEPAAYGAARDQLDQLVSDLDQLASGIPLTNDLQTSASAPSASSPASMTTRRTVNMPIIDPGLFVIQGVNSCGAGAGYCMLGTNCSLDVDFTPDMEGNCDGLLTAFTPAANFSCCKFDAGSRMTATPRPTPTTTEGTTFDDGLVDSIVNFGDEVPEQPTDENSQIVDIVAIITDSTGIVDIVTRPYTGPWPPVDDDDDGAVTLPFAKPGETFAPGSMVGLGQNGVNLGGSTTPSTQQVDSFQSGDLPQDEETASSLPAAADALLTTVATTPASVASTTPGPLTTAAESPPPSSPVDLTQLGPLAAVPVMDQDLDYIGDVDYDQHLLPALMPIRPGTKAGGVETAGAGSGDGPAEDAGELNDDTDLGEDLFATPAVAEVPSAVSEAGVSEGSGEAEESDQEKENSLASSSSGDHILVKTSSSVVGQRPVNSAIQTSFEVSHQPEHVSSGSDQALVDNSATADNHITLLQRPPADAEGAKEGYKPHSSSEPTESPSNDVPSGAGVERPDPVLAAEPVLGSLSTTTRPPVCGMMGSSLASLIARSRYRHRTAEAGTSRVVGGEVTSTVVWCWMAAIMRRTHDAANPYSFVCSGTLVERDLVLTTASCASRLFQEPLRNFVVLLGASNLRVSLDFGVQHMELEEIIIHEDYTINNDIYANDIGLVKLARPASLARTVCLLCLPPESMELTGRQSCSVTGYGLSDSTGGQRPLSSDDAGELEDAGVLRQTSMSVMPSDHCSSQGGQLGLPQPSAAPPGLLCAGDARSADACFIARDGGSPLSCMAASGRYYLYGMVSYSGGCGDQHTPRLYTSVASYFSWIRDNYERMKMQFRVRADYL